MLFGLMLLWGLRNLEVYTLGKLHTHERHIIATYKALATSFHHGHEKTRNQAISGVSLWKDESSRWA